MPGRDASTRRSPGTEMERRTGPSPATARPLAVGLTLDRMAAFAGLMVVLGIAGWVAATSLQQDLAAFVTAGRARAAGLDPYRNHLPLPGAPWDGVSVYRHSRFLYPPIVAEAFRPLAALPYAWGKIIFTAVSVVGLGLGLRLARPPTSPDGAGPSGPATGVVWLAVASWPPVFTTLERGQIDLLLLPLLALAWRRRGTPLVGGAALAACALAKPFVLAVWPILIVARRGRLALAATGVVVALLGIGALVSGPALSREYLREVLPRAVLHGEGGPEGWLLPDEVLAGAGDRLADGTAQLDAGGRRFAQQIGDFRRNASVVRLLAGDGTPPTAAGAVVFGALAVLLAASAARRPQSPAWFWGALLAGVAASPVAWAMSLPLGLPLLLAAPEALQKRAGGSGYGLALLALYAAGALGPWVPGAWCVAALSGVAAGVLAPTPPVDT